MLTWHGAKDNSSIDHLKLGRHCVLDLTEIIFTISVYRRLPLYDDFFFCTLQSCVINTAWFSW